MHEIWSTERHHTDNYSLVHSPLLLPIKLDVLPLVLELYHFGTRLLCFCSRVAAGLSAPAAAGEPDAGGEHHGADGTTGPPARGQRAAVRAAQHPEHGGGSQPDVRVRLLRLRAARHVPRHRPRPPAQPAHQQLPTSRQPCCEFFSKISSSCFVLRMTALVWKSMFETIFQNQIAGPSQSFFPFRSQKAMKKTG